MSKAQGYTKETITTSDFKHNLPEFRVGDTIAITRRIKEGDKERTQVFEGDVIAIHKRGMSSTFTVRKIGAHGVAVELILPFASPMVKSVSVVKHGNVRRSKLYYIRSRVGRGARLQEKIMTQEQKEQQAADKAAAHDQDNASQA